MAKHNEWGRQAETIAAEYLLKKGYVIRERNWSPFHGHIEIDIITQQGDSIIFVEVKARQSKETDPADAVDSRKQRRLIRAADSYLRLQSHDFEYRFDIITISGNIDDYILDHIEDAFLPEITSI